MRPIQRRTTTECVGFLHPFSSANEGENDVYGFEEETTKWTSFLRRRRRRRKRRRFEPAVTRDDDAKETHPRERSVDFKTAGGVDEEESGYFRRAVAVYARQRDEESVFTFD